MAQTASSGKAPPGLRIPATLSARLSSKANVGDIVRLEVISDVHDKTGAIAIPRRANLFGKVLYAERYKKGQPSILSFSIDRAEWEDHTLQLDAPVFGTFASLTDSKTGEMVEGTMAATFRHADSLNLVDTELMYDFRLSGNVPQALHDATVGVVVMQLELLPDRGIAAFVRKDADVELPRAYPVVLLNGMKVVGN